jgi:N5-(carboxyethyl)ornithine synthase
LEKKLSKQPIINYLIEIMKLGFIKPNYPNEKRVALLPEHIKDFENQLLVETGFGEYMDIPDTDYKAKACSVKS